MSLNPRVLRIGTVTEGFRLSEVPVINSAGDITLPEGSAAPISVRTSKSVSIHVKISNLSGLTNVKLGVYLYNILPSDAKDLGLQGVNYGVYKDISSNGEYMLDIVDTAAMYIDPVIEASGVGSMDVTFIIAGKEG